MIPLGFLRDSCYRDLFGTFMLRNLEHANPVSVVRLQQNSAGFLGWVGEFLAIPEGFLQNGLNVHYKTASKMEIICGNRRSMARLHVFYK